MIHEFSTWPRERKSYLLNRHVGVEVIIMNIIIYWTFRGFMWHEYYRTRVTTWVPNCSPLDEFCFLFLERLVKPLVNIAVNLEQTSTVWISVWFIPGKCVPTKNVIVMKNEDSRLSVKLCIFCKNFPSIISL